MRISAAVAVLLLIGASPVEAETRLPPYVRLLGEVTASAQPVENVLVIAFGLSNFEAKQAFTAADGAFRFPPLPTGVYRLVAVKQGFAPAVATIVPGSTERVVIKLRPGKASEEAQNKIWEIRRSLPPDVLRELDAAMTPPREEVAGRRFNGEMSSMTGMSSAERMNAFAQTSVALRGNFSGWSVDLAGRMQQVQPASSEAFRERSSESSGLVMAVSTSPSQTVRIVSSKNWWRLDPEDQAGDNADVQSHRIEWSRPDSQVELRYVSQENLFRGSDGGSEMFEVAGKKQVYAGDRGDIGVAVHVWQESTPSDATAEVAEYRVADVSTRGRFAAAERVAFTYGVNTRVTAAGQAWSPESGVEVRVGRGAIVASGAYKLGANTNDTYVGLPSIITSQNPSVVGPKYRYSVGYTSSNEKGAALTALLTVSAIDRALGIVFEDALLSDGFWEGYVLEPGDVHRDLTIACHRTFAQKIAVNFTSTAAETSNRAANEQKRYVSTSFHTLYRPSGTAIDVAYRLIDQPEREEWLFDSSSERLNLRLAQALHLPLDLTLLVGVDLARAAGLARQAEADEVQRRYVGGLSLAF